MKIDVAEPLFFGRDMEGLFTREQDFALVRRGVEPEKGMCFFFSSSYLKASFLSYLLYFSFTKKDLAIHQPFRRHAMDGLHPALDHSTT